jgi:hypothetical protein
VVLQYSSVASAAIERVPTLARERAGEDNSSPYEVLGELALLMVDEIELRREGHVVEEALPLLGEMAASADDQVVNLLVTGVLEVLGDSPLAREAMRRVLSGPACDLLERVIREWD